ncbi:MAG TPA: hypothetical protein VFZ41_00665, partial [Solirubrobacterales bacterium]
RRTEKQRVAQRRIQASEVAALNAFTANLREDARAGLRLRGPDEAMRTLAGAVEDGTLRVPRLSLLDSLVKLARRRGEALRANDAALNALLTALVERAAVPGTDVDASVSTVRGALEAVSRLPEATSAGEAWQVFAGQTAVPLRLTQAEIDKPQCNDTEVVVKGSYQAVGVTVEFHTDATPGDLRHFCDPTRWHECSSYQHEMTLWDGPGAVNEDGPSGWRRDLVETVDFWGGKRLVTPLRFTHTREAGTDPDWVHLDYVLLAETPEIAVDEGALDLRRVTSGTQQGRTRVSAKKAILFKEPVLASWPTIACDTFWTDLVIAAAVGCPDDGGAPPNGGGTTMADKLEKVIEEAAKATQESVDAYAKLAKEAATQFTGDAPADAGTWMQLTARTYAQAAADTARAWNTYNEVLKSLAKAADDTQDSGPTDSGQTDSDDGDD